MQRLLVFTISFPPLALVVFNAPDVMARADFRLLNLTALQMAYVIALVPAWLLAGIDFLRHRTLTTAMTGAALCYRAAFCIGFPFVDPFAVMMVGLVGALPAALCSRLSKFNPVGACSLGNQRPLRVNRVGLVLPR